MPYSDILAGTSLSLDPSKRNCRVLHLLPGTDEELCIELHTIDLDNSALSYACLSYVWGDAAITKPIRIHGQNFQVTTNLFAFLYHVKHPHDTIVLWIDAVCINQEDLDEKSHQVGMMGEIYARCSTVYIWLGAPPDPASIKKDPFELMKHFADGKHYHDLPGFSVDEMGQIDFEESEEFIVLWEAFLCLANSTWWTRAWTVQETILPANSVVLYGNWKTKFDTFSMARIGRNNQLDSCCVRSRKAFPGPLSQKLDLFLGEIERIDHIHYPRHKRDKPILAGIILSLRDPPNFHEVVLSFAGRDCKDPRDKIFSLLAMAQSPEFDAYRPSYYETVADCYTEVFKRMIEANGSDYRIFLGNAFGASHSGIPSWVRDFSQVYSQALVQTELRRLQVYDFFNASDGRTCERKVRNGRELHVIGVRADMIIAVGPVIESIYDGPDAIRGPLAEWTKLCKQAISLQDKVSIRKNLSRVMCATLNHDLKTSLKWRRQTESDLPGENEWQKFMDGDVWALDTAYEEAVELAIASRSLYITQTGKVGICNRGAQPDDEVWALFGFKMPFVLRKATKEHGLKKASLDWRLLFGWRYGWRNSKKRYKGELCDTHLSSILGLFL